MPTPAWTRLDALLRAAPPSRPPDVSGVPEPVERYFAASLAAGSPAAPAAVLSMRGHIRIGRWLPFRARQLLAPRFGTVWEARVGGVIAGSDRYVSGSGGMAWKLLGVVPFVRAEGSDVTRSAAERAAGESIWVPYAVAPGTGTAWSSPRPDVIAADVDTDGHVVRVEHRLDGDGRLVSSSFLRWGDPDRTGSWAQRPFGVEVADHRRFDTVQIPSRGEAGWHYGTERWPQGAFFRFDITEYTPFPA
jgi:hypothetical protein